MVKQEDIPIICARCKEITFKPVFLQIPPYDEPYVLNFTVVCPECARKARKDENK